MLQKSDDFVKVIILILTILIALAGGDYYYWSQGDFYVNISDDGIDVKKGFASSNEEDAAELLRKYAAAQKIYHKHKGFYARGSAELLLTIDGDLRYLDANVTFLESTRERDAAWNIYSYIPVEKQADGFVNRKTGFILCAAPNGYENGAAIHTLSLAQLEPS